MAVVQDITRNQVQEWLSEYDGQVRPTKKLRQYLLTKMGDVEDPMVDTTERDGLGDQTHVVDMILGDLTSYAP
jgi:hypothetical protein